MIIDKRDTTTSAFLVVLPWLLGSIILCGAVAVAEPINEATDTLLNATSSPSLFIQVCPRYSKGLLLSSDQIISGTPFKDFRITVLWCGTRRDGVLVSGTIVFQAVHEMGLMVWGAGVPFEAPQSYTIIMPAGGFQNVQGVTVGRRHFGMVRERRVY